MAEKQNALYEEFQTRSSDYSSQDEPQRNSHDRILSDVSPAEARRIKFKIDARLVVLVGFMYCISLMDRTNLANAKIAGYVNFENRYME
jgi:MFS transporter, ACS family, DAL5 transporter family protein